MNNNINKLEQLSIETIKIGEKASIKIGEYKKRGTVFYDIELSLNDKNIFLGRFNKNFDKINVKYNNGKILIYYNECLNEIEETKIIKVLSLYEMGDDTFYACTEEEALKIFDGTVDNSYLKNKNNFIHRSDIEKRKRLV